MKYIQLRHCNISYSTLRDVSVGMRLTLASRSGQKKSVICHVVETRSKCAVEHVEYQFKLDSCNLY